MKKDKLNLIKILNRLFVKKTKRQVIDQTKMSGLGGRKKNLVREAYPEYVKNSQNSIRKKKPKH